MMELKYYSDDDGHSLLVKRFENYNLAPQVIGNVVDHLRDIKNMKCRPDDVFLVTYPRCGTHWGREIINMLLRGEAIYIDKAVPDSSVNVTPIDVIDSMTSPRPLYSHMYFKYLPEEFLKNRGKIIHITRNPKDCAVSFYNIASKYKHGLPKVIYEGSWDQWLKMFTSGRVPSDSYFRYHQEAQQFMRENPDYPILNVYFENMKKDLKAELKKMAEFLEVPYTEKLLCEIADKCTFKNIKKQKAENLTDYSKDSSVDGSEIFYRKGEVGEWKTWFTVTQSEWFDSLYAEEMKDCEHKVIYSI